MYTSNKSLSVIHVCIKNVYISNNDIQWLYRKKYVDMDMRSELAQKKEESKASVKEHDKE